MLPPGNESISKISKETHINEQTLRNWRDRARKSGADAPGNDQVAERWSSHDKFLIVLETAGMNESELAEYCRIKGLFAEEIKAWKNVCMQANGGVAEEASRLNKELKAKSKEVKNLEKELQRKKRP